MLRQDQELEANLGYIVSSVSLNYPFSKKEKKYMFCEKEKVLLFERVPLRYTSKVFISILAKSLTLKYFYYWLILYRHFQRKKFVQFNSFKRCCAI
jgi:hypothetical protein